MPSLLDRISARFRGQPAAGLATVTTTTADETPRRVDPVDIAGALQADTERRTTVKTCREMYKKDPRAKGVIKALARDMTRGGFTVTVKGHKEAETVAAELSKRLDLEHTLDDWVRLTLRDGDTFLELGVDGQNQIALVTRKPPLRMHRASDDADRFPDPARAYWLAPEHWFGDAAPADATWFAAWQIVHARWDHDSEERYGEPLFAAATGAYKRIKEGETDIAVRRKTRAGIKYNHQFPEGTTPDQIESYKALNQDNLNDPTAAIADFFGTAQIAVVQGEGGALEAIGDVMHHIRTWWLASPVPMSLLGYGQDLNRDVLQEQKDQYDRALESLTQWVEAEFVRPLLERQWLLAGILPAGLDYEVKWKTTENLKIEVVSLVGDTVKKLTDAGLPKLVAWELVERFLPGVDLTQAKEEMRANAEKMAQQMQQAAEKPQPPAPQAPPAQPPPGQPQPPEPAQPQAPEPQQQPQAEDLAEAGTLARVVAEYQRAAELFGQLLERQPAEAAPSPDILAEYNPNHSPTTGQFASGPGAGTAPAGDVRLTHHAFQRMAERGKYASVRQTLKKLTGTPTPAGDWFVAMARGGKLDGYMVGTDGVVKTVLGAWYDRGKLRGEEVMLTEAKQTDGVDVRRSIQWQLDHLTPELVAAFCQIAGRERMTAESFRESWADWTPAGLECLLIARSEVEDPEPEGAADAD